MELMILGTVMSALGSVLTILFAVYFPRILSRIDRMNQELHQLNVNTEKRLATLEAIIGLRNQRRND